ncbi:MAG: hypothetical protein ACM32O_14460 [Clostridia bacterium]
MTEERGGAYRMKANKTLFGDLAEALLLEPLFKWMTAQNRQTKAK